MPSSGDVVETYEGNLREQAGVVDAVIASSNGVRDLVGTIDPERWRRVTFAGSGTSRYAGALAARTWCDLVGSHTRVVPARSLYEEAVRGRHDTGTVIAISQSGTTTSLVEGVRRRRAAGALTVAITDAVSSPLAQAADVVVLSPTGAESIFAKTKGFMSTALTAAVVGRAAAGVAGTDPEAARAFDTALERLPDLVRVAIHRSFDAVADVAVRLEGCSTLVVVGPTDLMPAVDEGALKILEVAKLPVLAFEVEESLHGPFNAFGPDTGLVRLEAEARHDRGHAFDAAAAAIGAPAATIAVSNEAARADVVVPRSISTGLDSLLAVIPLQALASAIARRRGVDPDTTRYPQLYAVYGTKSGANGGEGSIRSDNRRDAPHQQEEGTD